MIRTDTTIDQDRRTEGNCVCMYTVQCRVIADNKCEFQLLLSTVIATLMQDPCTTHGKTHKLSFMRFFKMNFVHRLTLDKK